MSNFANVSSEGVDGNLIYYDAAKNVILTIDGTNRALTIHASAEFTAAGIAFHDIPTENVASPAIWNDGGVLKLGSA